MRPALSVSPMGMARPTHALPAILFLIAVICASLGGCSTPWSGDPPSVLLISIDTCRPDRLGCYGSEAGATPNLDRLAAEGVLCQHAVSPIPITLPAHASILTGKIPPSHEVRDNERYVLSEDETTLAELLDRSGYETGAVVASFVLDSQFGLSQGFRHYDDAIAPSGAGGRSERPADEVTEHALEWLDSRNDDPFFLFVHYYDAHAEYDPPEPYASRFPEDPYTGEIAYVDASIGRVVDKLRQMDRLENTLIVIVGDHGESLGEHGETGHSYFVYDSTVRVPMILRGPGVEAGRRIPEPVSLVDVAPTILEWTGHDIPAGRQGRILALAADADDAAPDPAGKRYLYSESLTPTKYGCSPLVALTSGNWKYIHSSRPELYNLDEDPAESRNRIEEDSNRAAVLQAKLLELRAGTAVDERPAEPRHTPDPETLERLRSLGYVAGRSVQEDVEIGSLLDPPVTGLALHEGMQQVIGQMRRGEFELARATAEELSRRYPAASDIHLLRGNIEHRAGRPEAAIPFYKRFIDHMAGAETPAESPDMAEPNLVKAHLDLANALAESGEKESALGEYETVEELEPGNTDALFNHGITLAELGHVDAAMGRFREILTRDPQHPEAHFNLGQAFYMRGRHEEALREFMAAYTARPGFLRARLWAAEVRARRGDFQGSLTEYRAAVQERPDAAEAWTKLARAELARGAEDAALAAYEEGLRNLPGSPVLANDLAWVLATHTDSEYRDGKRAVALARQACEDTGYQNPLFLRTLAAAYAEEGRFEQAVSAGRQALAICEARGLPLAEDLRRTLGVYQSGQTIRFRFESPTMG